MHRKDCPQLSKINFQREDVVEVRWKSSQTPINKLQKIIVMRTTRNRLMMMLSVAPEEMHFSELVYLGKKASSLGDWEVTFRTDTLYGLKKIIRHFDRSGLTYEFGLEH